MFKSKYKEGSLGGELFNGMFYTALAKYSGIVINLLITAVLARILSPSDFGIIAIATIVINFFSTLTSAGIAPAIVQNKTLSYEDLTSINTLVIILSFISTGAFVCLIPLIVSFYDNSSLLSNLLYILSISILTAISTIVPNALLMKEKRFKFIAIRTFLVQVTMGGISIILAYKGFGAYSLLVNPVLGNIILLIINFRAYPIGVSFKGGGRNIRKIFSFSIYQMLFNLMYMIYRNVDKILIGKVFSVQTLGYYEKSYRLMMLPLDNISNVMGPVLHPVLSNYQSDKDFLWKSYLKILSLLSEIGCFANVVIYFSSGAIINIIYGSQWHDAIPYFQILSLSIGVQCMQAPVGAILQSINRVKGLFFASIIITLLVLSSLGVGLYYSSMIIFCWCLVISFTISFGVYQLFLLYFFNKSPVDIIRSISKPFISNTVLFLLLSNFSNDYLMPMDFKHLLVFVVAILFYQGIVYKLGFMEMTKNLIKSTTQK
ncbi:lipopolysaccharide biosynthesis protein [Alloprevotella sp. OH1205_COT-284]|uniref:lipopolysaccharide biosynthesis protein n=1 Tax=Alloprevotella sp. OH1205_COT-284 TaxID=2491043 RepID=UPI000F6032A4|nr:lipopolysaccharide biosynthesis protein [Alloprevotella sp. OH1205_COT-284]RRD80593.1 lipopolysaccharide biosynthesis protein [Alloprevotella sp. OH1205_COT-284]